jgi:WhiB family redox-sensing transcriptional regulator
MTLPDLRWQKYAVCRQYDPELFFQEGSHNKDWEREVIRLACGVCPVRQRCLDYALDHPEPQYGVWGGLTEKQLGAARHALGRRYGSAFRARGTTPNGKEAA